MLHSIKVTRIIPASAEQIFDILSNHEGYHNFDSVTDSGLVAVGHTDRNGVGAIRTMKVGGFLVLLEQITRFEPAKVMEYRVLNNPFMVNHHGGSVVLTPNKKGTLVTWTSNFTVEIPILGAGVGIFLKSRFKKGFSDMLKSIEKRLSVKS